MADPVTILGICGAVVGFFKSCFCCCQTKDDGDGSGCSINISCFSNNRTLHVHNDNHHQNSMWYVGSSDSTDGANAPAALSYQVSPIQIQELDTSPSDPIAGDAAESQYSVGSSLSE
ncbi:MAG: hypothetical protein O3C05_01920 [Proteobacteria bacterium]|nr:hypothetical protein [Pseudomonadota bacterium]